MPRITGYAGWQSQLDHAAAAQTGSGCPTCVHGSVLVNIIFNPPMLTNKVKPSSTLTITLFVCLVCCLSCLFVVFFVDFFVFFSCSKGMYTITIESRGLKEVLRLQAVCLFVSFFFCFTGLIFVVRDRPQTWRKFSPRENSPLYGRYLSYSQTIPLHCLTHLVFFP